MPSSMDPSTFGAAPALPTLDGSAALPPGTRLGEFEVRAVLGSGGFGIVYLAWDHALEREVALKEYLPGTLAGRGEGLAVTLRSAAHADTFALGLRSFVNEGRMLARFDHPSLVKVYRFWEANGTAYMVMPYYKGRTLRHMRQGMIVAPGEGACRRVVDALLSALEVLHKEGVFHRDIAPDNILIGDDGVPVLLDFGAARRVIGEGTQALTSIIKPHYAPLEQYADQGSMRQGPWTDLYALGGTAYYLLTGKEPVPAASRALHDDMPRMAELAQSGCSPGFLAAIDWMLALKPPERPQSVPMLRDVLEGRITLPGRGAADRTVPGVAARDPRPRIDFDPTGDVPLLSQPSAVSGPHAPTMLISSGSRSAPGAPMAPSTLPPAAPASVPPTTTAPAAAPAAARVSHRSRNLLLLALLATNALAWWWSFQPRMGGAAPAATASAAASAAPAVVAPAIGGADPAKASGTGVATNLAEERETVLSVLPARAQRPAAASAPAQGSALTSAAALAPAASANAARAADAAASAQRARGADARAATAQTAVTVDAHLGPRERCGERNFLSMLICIKRECQAPALRNHPECVKMREQEDGSRRRDSQ